VRCEYRICHPGILVPEQRLKAALLDSGHRVMGSERVSEIMEMKILETRALNGSAEGTAHAVLVLERKQSGVQTNR
jgi:hypothetical protein